MPKNKQKEYNSGFDKSRSLLKVLFPLKMVGYVLKRKANKNQKKAEEIRNTALSEYNEVLKNLDAVIQNSKNTLRKVVIAKKAIMKNSMNRILKSYRRLNPYIVFNEQQGEKEIQVFMKKREDFKILKKSVQIYSSYKENRFDDQAFDIAILMLQDGTISTLSRNVRDVIKLRKKSGAEHESVDNLKIQSIGAIWEFSTLTFEYTLSSATEYLDSKLEIEKANELVAQLESQKEMMRIRSVDIEAINQFACLQLEFLEKLLLRLQPCVENTVDIIKAKDNFFHLKRIKKESFSPNELKKIRNTYQLAQIVKRIIDFPIISKSGKVIIEQSQFYSLQCIVENMITNSSN